MGRIAVCFNLIWLMCFVLQPLLWPAPQVGYGSADMAAIFPFKLPWLFFLSPSVVGTLVVIVVASVNKNPNRLFYGIMMALPVLAILLSILAALFAPR